MKRLFLISTLVATAIVATQAQIQKPDKNSTRNTQVKTTPPTTATKTTEPVPVSVYSLTSARVNIRTGNDNKEFPSKVYVTLMAKSSPAEWRNYNQFNLGNEMRINSNTEFGLNREGALLSLEKFQQQGLKLNIKYEPNFFLDAWKIESVTLILEFKDQFGNLHPTHGNKTITFSTAYGILNNEYKNMDCFTDGSFSPMTSAINKGY